LLPGFTDVLLQRQRIGLDSGGAGGQVGLRVYFIEHVEAFFCCFPPEGNFLSEQAAQIYLLTGSDPVQIMQEAEKLMLQLAGPSPDPFSCDIIQESESVPSSDLIRRLLRSIESRSFLGGSKIVWLKHYSGFSDESEGRGRADDGSLKELAKRIQDGLPADVILVMDGAGCDGRKALAKACGAKGDVRIFNRPDMSRKTGLAEMAAILQRTAQAKGVILSREAEEYLLETLGGDTSLIDCELEKLICYCGGAGQPISLEAVEHLCCNRAEEQFWVLGDCLGKRDLREALAAVDSMVSRSKDADRAARSLIFNAANFFRQALRMLLFMAEHKLKNPSDVKFFLNSHPEIGKAGARGSIEAMHPYRAMLIAEQAQRYTPGQMIQAMRSLRDALWQTTSSAIHPHLALENALIKILGNRKQ